MKQLSLSALLALAFLTGTPAKAATILFDLQGTAGVGLLPGNEPGTVTGGTGGESGAGTAGISYDNVTKILSIKVGWGSSQGFSDLSSTLTASHIHGPTTSNNGAGFTQTAGVLFSLTPSSTAATGGTFNQNITLTAAQETDLLNGKDYINIHTTNNSGGELRGFLVAVPEPSRVALALLGLSVPAFRRRR